MSTTPSVIDRFVDYYAELDNQPPSALAAPLALGVGRRGGCAAADLACVPLSWRVHAADFNVGQ